MVMQRLDIAPQTEDDELDASTSSRIEFQKIARELTSFSRIEEGLVAVSEKLEDETEWADRVEAVRRHVDVSFAGTNAGGGYTFNIRFRSDDPTLASHFLRSLGEQFLRRANERNRRQYEREAARLDARIAAYAREIASLEEKLRQARTEAAGGEEESRASEDEEDPSRDAAWRASLRESDLYREYRVQKTSYRSLSEQRNRLTEIQKSSGEDRPLFRVIAWPSDRPKEVGRRLSGVALLAGAVGCVLGLIGALSAMLLAGSRNDRSRF